MLTSIEDPILRNFYLLFVGIFLVGIVLQFIWLKKNSTSPISDL
ncbi:MAG: hypothetical protein ACI9DH_000069 [Halioglobus sp.]